MARNMLPPSLLLLALLALVVLVATPAMAFSSRSPPPQSPYDRRPPRGGPFADDDNSGVAGLDDREAAAAAAPRPLHPMLGPGSRVAVAGAEVAGGNTLARLVTMKLFKSQHRPYLVVPSLDKTPTGLGFDQYRGLTRYICTAPKDRAKEGEGAWMCVLMPLLCGFIIWGGVWGWWVYALSSFLLLPIHRLVHPPTNQTQARSPKASTAWSCARKRGTRPRTSRRCWGALRSRRRKGKG